MAIVGFPFTAAITSWGSGSDLVAKLITYNGPLDATVTADADLFDVTAMGSTFKSPGGKGRIAVKFTIDFQLATPQDGRLGLVTYGSGVTFKSWDLNINREMGDITPFGQQFYKYIPGQVSWDGTIVGFSDDATWYGPARAGEAASSTFTVISGGTGKQLVGSIVTKSSGKAIKRGSVVEDTYSFVGQGALTTTGSSTAALWAADGTGASLTALENTKTLVLQAATGQTLSGIAMWNSIKIKNAVGQNVGVSISGMFSDTVTGLTIS
jgi:hypothetical protein